MEQIYIVTFGTSTEHTDIPCSFPSKLEQEVSGGGGGGTGVGGDLERGGAVLRGGGCRGIISTVTGTVGDGPGGGRWGGGG
ncbi:hypothetical protein CRG98_000411 [Punica granatum]|uniref:Uncharacterized protein n=1 Tax=Punica granatum TaxID=22663 RepID=A0A2I0LEM0_PUNGR|nr:hypothetical protein CRG98_000411 [Punica granatum]